MKLSKLLQVVAPSCIVVIAACLATGGCLAPVDESDAVVEENTAPIAQSFGAGASGYGSDGDVAVSSRDDHWGDAPFSDGDVVMRQASGEGHEDGDDAAGGPKLDTQLDPDPMPWHVPSPSSGEAHDRD